MTRGLVRSPIERESCEPLTVPETPQYEVAMLPVTVEPTCSKVAVATEPPQLDRSSDMKLPLQVPTTLTKNKIINNPVTEFEP